MIELSNKQYKLIKPLIKNIDELLKKDQAEDIIVELGFYLTANNSEIDAIYSDHDSEVEHVMDYINSHYNCYAEK